MRRDGNLSGARWRWLPGYENHSQVTIAAPPPVCAAGSGLPLYTGRDMEEKEEQWLVFQEAIAVTSSVKMPRPSPSSSSTGPSQNLALISPVKVENTTSIEALKVGSKVNGYRGYWNMSIAMVTDRIQSCSECPEVWP